MAPVDQVLLCTAVAQACLVETPAEATDYRCRLAAVSSIAGAQRLRPAHLRLLGYELASPGLLDSRASQTRTSRAIVQSVPLPSMRSRQFRRASFTNPFTTRSADDCAPPPRMLDIEAIDGELRPVLCTWRVARHLSGNFQCTDSRRFARPERGQHGSTESWILHHSPR
jgi:hypothetical protein